MQDRVMEEVKADETEQSHLEDHQPLVSSRGAQPEAMSAMQRRRRS